MECDKCTSKINWCKADKAFDFLVCFAFTMIVVLGTGSLATLFAEDGLISASFLSVIHWLLIFVSVVAFLATIFFVATTLRGYEWNFPKEEMGSF